MLSKIHLIKRSNSNNDNKTSLNVKPACGAFCRCKRSKSKQRRTRSTGTSSTATAASDTSHPLPNRNRRRTSPFRCRKTIHLAPPATSVSVLTVLFCAVVALGWIMQLYFTSHHAHFYTLERCTRLKRGLCFKRVKTIVHFFFS